MPAPRPSAASPRVRRGSPASSKRFQRATLASAIVHGLVLLAVLPAITPETKGRAAHASTAARVFVAYAPPVSTRSSAIVTAEVEPLIEPLVEPLVEPDVASPQPAEELATDPAPKLSRFVAPRPRVEILERRLEKPTPESASAAPAQDPGPAPKTAIAAKSETGLVVGASVLQRVQPRYPSRCRRRGHRGEVHVRVVVSASGQPGGARVVRSAGCERLDGAALEAVQRFRFRPAQQAGRAVGSTVRIAVRFQERA